MSDSTRTGPKSKPLPPEPEIVELKPPEESGFGGTLKLYRAGNEATIKELLQRGYVEVPA